MENQKRTNTSKIIIFIITGIILTAVVNQYLTDEIHKPVYIKQEQKYYCAEACIQMILNYYNIKPIPSQSEIAMEVNHRNNKTYTSDMSKPFINRNLRYEIYSSKNFTQSYKKLINISNNKPAIILITWDQGEGHFLIVYKTDVYGIYCIDPNKGYDFITKERLKQLWFDNCIKYPPQEVCWCLIFN